MRAVRSWIVSKHLASSEQQRSRFCEMCEAAAAYPPALFCAACLKYMRDCEAEMGSDQ